jgi:hypothetical protein
LSTGLAHRTVLKGLFYYKIFEIFGNKIEGSLVFLNEGRKTVSGYQG